MLNLFKHLSAMYRIKDLPLDQRRLVIYSEGSDSWTHFESIVERLLEVKQPFVFYSSKIDDPGLAIDSPLVHVAFIGDKTARTILFASLEAHMVLMTMPDLGSFHLKRSPLVKHYAYVHHSMVSHHMIYRKHAFDHFDSILCVGPHHKTEIRQMEVAYKSKKKICIAHGYGRLDTLMKSKFNKKLYNDPKKIVIAPSYGPEGLLEKHAFEIVGLLLEAGFDVAVRPHPITYKKIPKMLGLLNKKFTHSEKFRIETNISDFKSLCESDLMISDWSGAALEFAFATERPVLYIDVPKKILNGDYNKIKATPLEVTIRNKLGKILTTDDLATIPLTINDILASGEFANSIKEARDLYVFNLGNSASFAVKHIIKVLGEPDHGLSCTNT